MLRASFHLLGSVGVPPFYKWKKNPNPFVIFKPRRATAASAPAELPPALVSSHSALHFRPFQMSASRSESDPDAASAPAVSTANKPEISFCQSCGGATKQVKPDGEEKLRAVCTLCGKIYYENPKMVSETQQDPQDAEYTIARRLLNRLEQDVGMILKQTANYRWDERIGRMEWEAAERAMVWDRRFDGLSQQLFDVVEGLLRVIAQLNALRQERSLVIHHPGFAPPDLTGTGFQLVLQGVDSRGEQNQRYGHSKINFPTFFSDDPTFGLGRTSNIKESAVGMKHQMEYRVNFMEEFDSHVKDFDLPTNNQREDIIGKDGVTTDLHRLLEVREERSDGDGVAGAATG